MQPQQVQQSLIQNDDLKLKAGSFGIPRDALIDLIATVQQNRTFDQELIKIENLGGVKKIMDLLHTNSNTGIEGTNDDLQARDEQFGNNKKEEVEVQTFWELLWAALGDLMLRVLIGAAVISITVAMAYPEKSEDRKTGWVDGFAILVAVFVCSVVAAANDYQKEKQFRSLNETAENKKVVQVTRAGEIQQLRYTEIMVGDLIQIEEGMQLPVDGIVIEASQVKCDESAMTGETDVLKKYSYEECMKVRNLIIEEGNADDAKPHDVPTPILLAGTQVVQGEGKFIALVVGEYSSEGKIKKLLSSQENESTPLQQKLEAIANDIGKFGLISAILIVSVLLIRFIIEYSINGWDQFNGGSIQEILRFLSIGVAIVVVAIPEGLPLSVTISLAYSVKKMLKDKNLVRKLQACETMGGADMICSDKTGTLTQNKMTLQEIWNQKLISVELYDQVNLNSVIPNEDTQLLFAISIALNTTAVLRPKENGNKTEISLLNFLDKTKFKYDTLKQNYHTFYRYPLTSSRKRMSTVIEFNGRKLLLIKGASEILLEGCTEYQDFSGVNHQLDDHLKKQIMEQGVEEMANHALRTLAIAYKYIDDSEFRDDSEDAKGVKAIEKSNLILLCIVGIKDALRKEVTEAVKNCKLAGIKVRMVTGDFKLTARAIAVECGITNPGDPSRLTLEGQEFITKVGGVVCDKCKTAVCECPRNEAEKTKMEKKFPEGQYTVRVDVIDKFDEFKRIVPQLDVLARSRPEDKYALVTGLKQMGHVVAVTGDGTNDAPALKKSDVGFSMGIAGTQVAREASDIVLLDDNFNSIVKAVIWGRNIYDSIKKFLQFQLTVNLVAVGSSLVSAAITKQETLTVIQMLWINLIMDSLAALALATEPPTEKLLDRKPHRRDEYIISRKMMKHIIGQAIFQMTVLMIFIFAGPSFLPEYDDDLDDHILEKLAANDQEYIERGGLNMKYSDALNKTGEMKLIRSGRLKMISESGLSDGDIKEQFKGQDYDYNVDLLGHSRHFTYVFNVFVWMQIFNFFNARKLNDEFNIFSGILSNSFFIVIVAVIIFIEIIVVTFGGKAFQCYEWGHGGLTIVQWFICLGFAAICFFVSFILKLIPESGVPEAGNKQLEPQNSIARSLRGSSKIKHQQSMEKPGSQLQQKQRISAKQIPAESEMAELDLKY